MRPVINGNHTVCAQCGALRRKPGQTTSAASGGSPRRGCNGRHSARRAPKSQTASSRKWGLSVFVAIRDTPLVDAGSVCAGAFIERPTTVMTRSAMERRYRRPISYLGTYVAVDAGSHHFCAGGELVMRRGRWRRDSVELGRRDALLAPWRSPGLFTLAGWCRSRTGLRLGTAELAAAVPLSRRCGSGRKWTGRSRRSGRASGVTWPGIAITGWQWMSMSGSGTDERQRRCGACTVGAVRGAAA
jgi:hypothetical protein